MKTPFDKFIGKDIWVLCDIKKTYSRDIRAYIRVYEIDSENDIECTVIPESEIPKMAEWHIWYATKQMNNAEYIDLNKVTIVKPLTTKTSQEICPEYVNDVSELMEFVGTGYWIKVLFTESYFNFETFIKILSAEGKYITYQSIRADVLAGDIYEKWDFTSAVEYMEDVEEVNAYNVKICRPLEMMSDEEMQEEIDRIGAEVAEWEDAW